MELRILNATDVRLALPMTAAVAAMKKAFAELARGEVTLPLRTQLDVSAHGGVALFMPAYAAGSDALAVKAVAVYPRNAQRGLPTIHGVVLVFEASSGRPVALLEGGALTAIRTGAASGAATDLLARPDAGVAAIIGSGVQARTQLEAVCAVRPIQEVRVYSTNPEQAEQFAREMSGQGAIPSCVVVAADADSAVQGADVVCTATTSFTPVFSASALSSGCHVNAVGSFRPDMQEIPTETVRQARLVVDQREAAQALAKKAKCTKCHSVDKKKDGPAYQDVAEKYKGKADAVDKLYTHLTTGPMVEVDGEKEEHEILRASDDEIRNLIGWILSR